MRKILSIVLALSIIALFGYGCDGEVCSEDGGYVTNAVSTTLYYPCNISSPTGATTMSSGYTQTENEISWLSQRLAEEGYVVLGMTPINTLGFVSQWRDMHKGGIDRLKNINSNHATLKGLINTAKLQCSGHSKGGGGTLWATAQLGSQLKTAIALAPYQEEFTSSTLQSITAETMIQAGSGDTLATNVMTVGEYNALPNGISKSYFEYSGYDHLAWTSSASSDRQDRIAGDAIAWMKYYMDGQTSYSSTLSNASGTTEHEWVDDNGGSSSSSSSSGGCN